MSVLTNLLTWVSAGLFVPVVLVIIGLLGWSLLMLGDFLGTALQRSRERATTRELADRLLDEPVRDVVQVRSRGRRERAGGSELARTLERCARVDWHPIHADRILGEFELQTRRGLDGPQVLIRLGPMLGLMGTLIPIGPALAGLAAGDVAAMAANVEEGLTATVVGLFVGGVGFWVRLVRQRWAHADAELLRYAYELAQEQSGDHRRRPDAADIESDSEGGDDDAISDETRAAVSVRG